MQSCRERPDQRLMFLCCSSEQRREKGLQVAGLTSVNLCDLWPSRALMLFWPTCPEGQQEAAAEGRKLHRRVNSRTPTGAEFSSEMPDPGIHSDQQTAAFLSCLSGSLPADLTAEGFNSLLSCSPPLFALRPIFTLFGSEEAQQSKKEKKPDLINPLE